MKSKDGQDEPTGFRIEFRLVGPMKRSTLGEKQPDREWEATNDVRYWSFCTRMQAERLGCSFAAEFPWGRARRMVAMERRFSATSYDEHCLIVAAANLDRALRKAPHKLRRTGVTEVTRRALQLLRNVYEHWDKLRACYRRGNTRSGAALKLSKAFPGVEPWTLIFHPDKDDLLIAGLVSVRSLIKDLRTLEARALWEQRRLRRLGRHVAKEAPNPSEVPSKSVQRA